MNSCIIHVVFSMYLRLLKPGTVSSLIVARFVRMSGVTHPLMADVGKAKSQSVKGNACTAREPYQCRHSTVSPYLPALTCPYLKEPGSMGDPLHGAGPWQVARLLLLYCNKRIQYRVHAQSSYKTHLKDVELGHMRLSEQRR